MQVSCKGQVYRLKFSYNIGNGVRMIYRGFNQNELKRITDILDRCQVQYHVSVPDASLEHINDPSKRVDHRFMDSLLQIEIDKSEFDKIPEKDIQKLFDLRIYKEEESPFTEEDFSQMEDPHSPAPEKKKDPNAKMNQIAAILAILTVIGFSMWKNGFFK